MKSNRNWMWFDIRYGWKFIYFIYMPNFFFVTLSYVLSPAWRKLDERYALRFSDSEGDEIETGWLQRVDRLRIFKHLPSG
jgi:hypothetical protein